VAVRVEIEKQYISGRSPLERMRRAQVDGSLPDGIIIDSSIKYGSRRCDGMILNISVRRWLCDAEAVSAAKTAPCSYISTACKAGFAGSLRISSGKSPPVP
jgi:hypothetical protein